MPADKNHETPRLLAIDTSTEVLSIAVSHGGRVFAHSGTGGAQASTTLIPAVMALLAEAGLALRELDAIVFGRGPGSFTGLRTACAVAQGLGYGAGVPLLPMDTLLAVAEDARARHGVSRVVAVLDARMDEVYAQAHDLTGWGDAGLAVGLTTPGSPTVPPPLLMRPEDVTVPEGYVLAGNAFAAYGDRLPGQVQRFDALPRAEAMLRLAPALLAAGGAVSPEMAWPVYIRDKVAQTTAEREAAKAARAVT